VVAIILAHHILVSSAHLTQSQRERLARKSHKKKQRHPDTNKQPDRTTQAGSEKNISCFKSESINALYIKVNNS